MGNASKLCEEVIRSYEAGNAGGFMWAVTALQPHLGGPCPCADSAMLLEVLADGLAGLQEETDRDALEAVVAWVNPLADTEIKVGDTVRVTLFKGKPQEKVVVGRGKVVKIYQHHGEMPPERYCTHYLVSGGTYFRHELDLIS